MDGGNEDSETQIESEAKDTEITIDDNSNTRRESPDNLPSPPETSKVKPEESARLEAIDNARLKAEEQDKLEAEAKAKAEESARLEAEEQDKLEAEAKAKIKVKARLEDEAEQIEQQNQQPQQSGELAQSLTLIQPPSQSSVFNGDDVPHSNSNNSEKISTEHPLLEETKAGNVTSELTTFSLGAGCCFSCCFNGSEGDLNFSFIFLPANYLRELNQMDY